jgi:hypothetical protein
MVELSEVSRHIERTIGPVETVFHEIVSDGLHIDVHHVKSSFFRRYEVLVTSGMSEWKMAVPDDSREARRAEILTVLPKGWPLNRAAFEKEDHYWPIRLIKSLARFPRDAGTWLGFGHTVANGSEATGALPYAPNIRFNAAAILPPMTLGKDVWSMKSKSGEEVFFWAAVPLYPEEMKFKLENGMDALLDLFDRHKVSERIDVGRASVVS